MGLGQIDQLRQRVRLTGIEPKRLSVETIPIAHDLPFAGGVPGPIGRRRRALSEEPRGSRQNHERNRR
jgi:hypothetical protein